MSIMATEAPSLPLTADELEAWPEDPRHRYELIDGLLVVSASPVLAHQRAVAALFRLLDAACPPGHEVLLSPFDVRLADDTVLVPDLVVAASADLTATNLPAAPVLAVEVLSPGTRTWDLVVKQERLARAGCPHYWVVDPLGPAVTAWRLDAAGEYAEVGRATGEETLSLAEPLGVTLQPASLVVPRTG